jgi:hypothetical protein
VSRLRIVRGTPRRYLQEPTFVDARGFRQSQRQQNQGSLVTATENDFLNHWLRNAAVAGIGDASGLQPSATAGIVGISFCTAWPGEAPNQTTNETNFNGYTRPTVARSAGGWNAASGGTISPAAAISAGTKADNTGDPLVLPYWILGDAASGTGTARAWGAFGNATFGARAFVANSVANDTIFAPAHGLAAGDRVAFFDIESGGGLPTGVTEGDVYFVRSGGLTTDEFTFATTAGGSAVNITALGSGIVIKIEPIILNQNTEARLGTSTLIRLA